MRVNHKLLLAVGACWAAGYPLGALAQDDARALTGLSVGELRGEIGRRYDDALRATLDPAVVNADNPRFLWASQAKAQCGIALGFLKSRTIDQVSIGKCDDAWRRMQMPVAVAVPPSAPPAPLAVCSEPIAGIVFFEWDSAVVPDSAGQTLDGVVANAAACRWGSLMVTGHTDRSGPDDYNNALSVRRANAVAALLTGRGLPGSTLQVSGRGESSPRVPTVDGERNPQNRRVEITVK